MSFRSVMMACCFLAGGAGLLAAADYDPLAVPSGFKARQLDLTVKDAARKRDVPLLVYLPEKSTPAPVVLFSHGLGGTRNMGGYLGNHWAARGYVAVFVQHPGSDDSVWKDKPLGTRMNEMRDAASLENLQLRIKDIPVTLDQLAAWNADAKNALSGRLDMKKIGMSGHSFGAVTTQAVSGQWAPLIGQKWTDPRIRAAIAFSPSSPRAGSVDRAFGSVKVPWMLMTGTHDTAPIGNSDVASRLAVYPALKGASKYELVLDGAEHSAFTDRALPGDKKTRNPNHHRVILALSTAFWDAYLKGDAVALTWLQGKGPRAVMETADRWRFETK